MRYLKGSSDKLWGGRFSSSTDPTLEELNNSLRFDKRMYSEDICGSQAYARSLNKINLLTDEETKSICEGLEKVKEEWSSGEIVIKQGDEDVHTVNERRLKVRPQLKLSLSDRKRSLNAFLILPINNFNKPILLRITHT